MIVVIRSWGVAHDDDPSGVDRRYLEAYVPLLRRVPRLRRHVVLRGVAAPGTIADTADDVDPTRRGDDLWFDDFDDLEAALTSAEWKAAEETEFFLSVVGPRLELAEILDEHLTSDSCAPGALPGGASIVLRSNWDIPTREDAASIDEYYAAVHVPNVRRIPGLHRHVVMRATESPSIPTAGWWRGADCWYDSRKDFEADREAHERTRNDGFAALTTGIAFEYSIVAEEWIPAHDN